MVYATIVIFLVLALVMSVSLACVTFRRCHSEKRYYFVLCMVAVVFMTLGYLLEITATSEGAAFTGVKVTYFGSCFLSPLFLLFVIDYCRVNITAAVFKIVRRALLIVAALNCLLAWTADRHHLLYASQYFDPAEPIRGLQVFPGPLYPVSYIIAMMLMFASSVILVRRFLSHKARSRKIYGIMMLIGLSPLAANLLYMFYVFALSPDSYALNFTPFVLVIVNTLFYMTVMRYGIFDFVPVAFTTVLTSLKDALVIVNADLECLEANRVALELFPGITDCRNGVPVTSSPHWPKELGSLLSVETPRDMVFTLTAGGSERVVEASVNSISERGEQLGHTVVIRDITENRRLLHELERAAYTDSLTGIYNRRHFIELATREFERSRRMNVPCYALFLDIDFFKVINDTYTHFAGDEVLRQIVARVREIVRSYDLFARYGGEEFIIMLAVTGDATIESAVHLAQRICDHVAAAPFAYNNIEIPVTLSIGVASSAHASSLEELLLHADNAVYRAKVDGRNQVAVHEKQHSENKQP